MYKILQKGFLFFCLFSLSTYTLAASNNSDKFSITGEDFFLAYENTTDTIKIKEYLKEGESLENFNQMFTIQKMLQVNDLEKFAIALAQDTTEPYASKALQAEYIEDINEFFLIKLIGSGNITELAMYRMMLAEDGQVALYIFSDRTYIPYGQPGQEEWLKESTDKVPQRVSALFELKKL